MSAAIMRKRTPGTTIETRHAEFSLMTDEKGLKRTHTMKTCVTPPPRFPQPAAVALAVPTTFGANISEHQNWLVTKVAPAQPIKVRIRMKDHSLLMPAAANSQMDPKTTRHA